MKDNKGVASIVVTIFVMLMLAVFVAVVSAMVAEDAYISINHLDSIKAFYIAQAGLARARTLLATGEWPFNANNEEYDISVGDGACRIESRYYRADNVVTITSVGYIPDYTNQRTKYEIYERLIPPPTRTNLSLGPGVNATASSSIAGNEPQYCKDATYSTYWQSQTKNGSWLALSFPSATDFDKVVFYQNLVSITPGNFHIQYRSGTSWLNVSNPTTSGTNPITVTFDKVTTDGIRLFVDYVSPSKGVKNPNITEFETYNGPDNLARGTFGESY